MVRSAESFSAQSGAPRQKPDGECPGVVRSEGTREVKKRLHWPALAQRIGLGADLAHGYGGREHGHCVPRRLACSSTVSMLPSATGWSLEVARSAPPCPLWGGFMRCHSLYRPLLPARVPPSAASRERLSTTIGRRPAPSRVANARLHRHSSPTVSPTSMAVSPRYSRSGSRLAPDSTLSPPSTPQYTPLGLFTVRY